MQTMIYQNKTAESSLKAVLSGVLFRVFLLADPIQLNAQHVERGGRWHDALPKLLDAPRNVDSSNGEQ